LPEDISPISIWRNKCQAEFRQKFSWNANVFSDKRKLEEYLMKENSFHLANRKQAGIEECKKGL
jgi:hypothetical protein